MDMRFGIQLAPATADLGTIRDLTRLADREGLELLGVQDHPYAPSQVDTFALMSAMLSETESIRVFPDVASLPLRGPAMIGKASATLDLLSGGRFELGLGSGGYAAAIAAMGGPRRTPGEALRATEEAIEIIRAMWRPGERVKVAGEFYSVSGVHSGPAPAHDVGIWFGSVGPRAHGITGRLADGWAAPIPHYLPYERWGEAQDLIDAAARDAGRDPGDITRLAQIVGDITDSATRPRLEGEEPVRTNPQGWAEVISQLAGETRFDTFIYWPERADRTQVLRWATEVVPAARALLDA